MASEATPAATPGALLASSAHPIRLPLGFRLVRASRRSEGWALVATALLIWGSFAAAASAASTTGTLCVFKTLTGSPCPTCGGTRLAEAALGGDFAGAFLLNPLLFAVGALLGALFLLRFGFGRHLALPETPGVRRALAYAALALLAANWLYVLNTLG